MSGGADLSENDNGNLWKSFIMAEMMKDPIAFAKNSK